MKRVIVFAILISLLSFTGCSASTDDMETARDYILSKGYNITSEFGETSRYTMENNEFWKDTKQIYTYQSWMLQESKPEEYYGKEITVYCFITDNHPLLDKINILPKRVYLYVMMSENKVIGGYSFPDADLYGGYLALDGSSFEEITGLNFERWQHEWLGEHGE